MGKYLPDIKNDYDEELHFSYDKNSFKKKEEKLIPNSEFKKQLSGVRLIPNEKLLNLTTKSLYDLYKQYENEINDNSSDDSGGPQPQMNQALQCPNFELAREAELWPGNQGGGASSEGGDIDIDSYLRSFLN